MIASEKYRQKVVDGEEAVRVVARWRFLGKRVVFTNGCFDILHEGHLDILEKAAALGDVLVVGLNADASVKRLKGMERPVNTAVFRSRMLAALHFTDLITVFEEDTPFQLIQSIRPDILVKGGDYRPQDIVGADIVQSYGGRVEVIPFTEGYSTTALIAKIRSL